MRANLYEIEKALGTGKKITPTPGKVAAK